MVSILRRRPILIAVLAAGAALGYSISDPRAQRGVLASLLLAVGAYGLLRWRRAAGRRRRLQALGNLLALTPAEFESAVAGLLHRAGYGRAVPCGGPADLGADIVCEDRKGRRTVVQCKRHAPGIAVGSGEIQRLLGTMLHLQADRGLFVTTSRFSSPAWELASRHDVELVDGEALTRLAGS